jgi:tetrahydromethanopterin S-methyltransferase subunit C
MQSEKESVTMYEVPAIIGACTNCIAPTSLVATLALILVGAVIAVQLQRRNQRLISVKIPSEPGRS